MLGCFMLLFYGRYRLLRFFTFKKAEHNDFFYLDIVEVKIRLIVAESDTVRKRFKDKIK